MTTNLKIKLTPAGMVTFSPQDLITARFSKSEAVQLVGGELDFPQDTAPEVVHLELTSACNMNCPYCYVKNKHYDHLSLWEWKEIIDQLAEMDVFQVTFGGGEPTLRLDLFELASYVKSKGMALGMTTNGLTIAALNNNLLELLKLFDQINVSFHDQPGFRECLWKLRSYGVKVGINFVMSKQYEKHLDFVVKCAKDYDAELLFLTYKPVNNDVENQIPALEVLKKAESLSKEIKVAVDGFTCDKCLAGKRFCDIDCMGNVYVCSFIREPIGNVLTSSFKEVWAKRPKKIKCPFKEKKYVSK